MLSQRLTDSFSRTADYLRVSVTDRCNLRCVYCMPEHGARHLDRSEVLTFEEIVRIAGVAVGLGVRKIRLTGGEPLVRKGVVSLVGRLAALPLLEDIGLTTNGILLEDMARPLRDAGLMRVNVSVDTLREDRYASVTRRGFLRRAMAGIEAAWAAGLSPVKINVVLMRGVNDDEVADLARLTVGRPWEVRFIEWMPAPGARPWESRMLVTGEEVLRSLESEFHLKEDPGGVAGGALSRRFRIEGAAGAIGFISPMTEHFCGSCNRLRLSADGRLRTCLFGGRGADLKRAVRGGVSDGVLAELIRDAVQDKPPGHMMTPAIPRECGGDMWGIGG